MEEKYKYPFLYYNKKQKRQNSVSKFSQKEAENWLKWPLFGHFLANLEPYSIGTSDGSGSPENQKNLKPAIVKIQKPKPNQSWIFQFWAF